VGGPQTQPTSSPPGGAGEGLSTVGRVTGLCGPGPVVAGQALVEGIAVGGRGCWPEIEGGGRIDGEEFVLGRSPGGGERRGPDGEVKVLQDLQDFIGLGAGPLV
jgi:hypothetical protein